MKKIAIIGGGIAGLSAGIFAQKNGFESVILEKNRTLGGECTGWNRHGYYIDGCIHWLVGTKKGTPMHDLWKTVGALDGVEIFEPESFLAVEYDGVTVHLYRDLDRLESSWLELSPQDEPAIQSFCQTIRKLQSYEVPMEKPEDLMNPVEKLQHLLSMKDVGMVLQKYGKVSLKEYAQSFQHPALRETLASFLPEGYSAASVFFALANFSAEKASIPRGGSRNFALRMADRYTSLGGKIEAPCEITEVIVDRNSVLLVIAGNGKTFEADYFIAACDANQLYERLLKGKYPDPDFQKRFSNPKDYPLASEIHIALGYEGTMDRFPRSLCFPISPIMINDTSINTLTITHYGHDPDFAPTGHTLITCSINQFQHDYDAWHYLAANPIAYQQQKARIGKAVIQAMESHFSHMQGKLTLLDVATPVTYEQRCNAYRGAFMSFLPTINGKMMAHTGKIKGLRNLFLSGQWLQPPGGLPVALITGKDTIMRICKLEKQPFFVG